MAAQGWGSRFVVMGLTATLGAQAVPGAAEAASLRHHAGSHGASLHAASFHHGSARAHAWHRRPAGVLWGQTLGEYAAVPARSHGISCVPFARENSNIELIGNAVTWWGHAAGVYARGNRPEVGSVLNFRATRRMRLGHVAVVANVLAPRLVEVDHANWSARGRVSHGVRVADVSPGNDWTQVRVALADGSGFGNVYPTYGFIYDKPDGSVLFADARASAGRTEVDEVAELPDAVAPRPAHGARHPRLHASEAARHYHGHRHAYRG